MLRDQWKKERDYRLSAARHAAIANEKEMIESRIRVEDLPSWVFFPDKARTGLILFCVMWWSDIDNVAPAKVERLVRT